MGREGSGPLGPSSSEGGVSDSLPEEPSSPLSVANLPYRLPTRFGEVSRAGLRGSSHVREGSCRGSFRSLRRFLQQAVRRPEGFRRLEACIGRLCLEHFRCSYEVQDGVAQVGSPCRSEERLDVVHRPAGRILPCASPSGVEEVPQVRVCGSGLSVQGSPIRPLDSSSSFHPRLRPSGEVVTSCGHSGSVLPGRLACPRSVAVSDPGGMPVHSRSVPGAGLRCQPQEVQSCPISAGNLFGDEHQFSDFLGFSEGESSHQIPQTSRRISHLLASSRQLLAGHPGAHDIPGGVHSRCPSSDEGGPILAPSVLGHGFQSSHVPNSSVRPSSSGPSVVELGASSSPGSSHSRSSPHSFPVLGRLDSGLGCLDGGPQSLRSLVQAGTVASYKHPGAQGCSPGHGPVGTVSRVLRSGRAYGQYDGAFLHPQAGRYGLQVPVSGSSPSPSLGRGKVDSDQDLLRPGREKRCGGQLEQSGSGSSSRVDPEYGGLSSALETVGTTSGGSVCHQGQLSPVHLCLPDDRRSGLGHGRDADSLGGPVSICLSPSVNDFRGSVEVRPIPERSDDTNRPILASAALVPTSIQPLPGPSSSAPSKSRSASAAVRKQSASRSWRSSSNRLVTIERRLRAQGFSRTVAQRVAAKSRKSTCNVYQHKWKVFRDWCISRDVSASKTPMTDVADFLVHLRDNVGLTVPTIEGYRSAISSVIPEVGTCKTLSDLLKSFAKDIPRDRPKKVHWNLDVVLQFLRSDRFEPLEACSLRDLTMKTLFLLALATAKRVSELQALSHVVGFSRDGALLSYIPSFIAKNETPSHQVPRSIKVRGLYGLVGRDLGEIINCPVRSLKVYLERTKNIRGPSKNLFCSIENPSNKLVKNGISWLIRALIRQAHHSVSQEFLPLCRVRAHDVRAVSTSVAFLRNTPVQAVIDTATWKTNSVFASHYLRDLSFKFGDVYSLGPVVSADSVGVGAPESQA